MAKTARTSIQKHTKSRTGCSTCKKRKIKCDEKRPSCGNCLKRRSQCDFVLLTSYSRGIVLVETIHDLNFLDLELLNNFTSFTYSTLSIAPELRNFWKHTVVQKALGCEFIMHAVLAVSATHLAQHRSGQKHYYISHAMAYHDVASRRAVSLMAELLPENLEDLWIFTFLTMFFTLSIPRDANESPLQIGDNVLTEWISLSKRTQQIRSALQRSPDSWTGMLALIERGVARWEASRKPEHRGANILHQLKAQISATVTNEDEKKMYNHAIQKLRCVLNYVLSSRSRILDLTDAFVWHTAMADGFMPLLQQGRQEAVVIFVHSLIIFARVNGSRWQNGWDAYLLARAWDVLNPVHRLWVQWPMEEIGWMPPC